MNDESERIEQGSHPEREEGNGARTAATALVAFGTLVLLFAAAVVVFLLIAELTRGQWMLAGSAVVVLAFLLWLGNRLVHVAANQNKNPLGEEVAARGCRPRRGGAEVAAGVRRRGLSGEHGFTNPYAAKSGFWQFSRPSPNSFQANPQFTVCRNGNMVVMGTSRLPNPRFCRTLDPKFALPGLLACLTTQKE